MDIWTATRTILEKSPEGIRCKDLLAKVKKKTGSGRSTIFNEWSSLFDHGKIYSEKGRYWLEKPTPRDFQTALEKHNLALEHSQRLLAELRESLFFWEPNSSDYYDALGEHLRSGYPNDYSKFYQKIEKYGESKAKLKDKLAHNEEDYKKAGFCSEQKKPLELVDDYYKWTPKTSRENTLKAELEKEVKNVKESYCELTEFFQTLDNGRRLKGTCHRCRAR